MLSHLKIKKITSFLQKIRYTRIFLMSMFFASFQVHSFEMPSVSLKKAPSSLLPKKKSVVMFHPISRPLTQPKIPLPSSHLKSPSLLPSHPYSSTLPLSPILPKNPVIPSVTSTSSKPTSSPIIDVAALKIFPTLQAAQAQLTTAQQTAAADAAKASQQQKTTAATHTALNNATAQHTILKGQTTEDQAHVAAATEQITTDTTELNVANDALATAKTQSDQEQQTVTTLKNQTQALQNTISSDSLTLNNLTGKISNLTTQLSTLQKIVGQASSISTQDAPTLTQDKNQIALLKHDLDLNQAQAKSLQAEISKNTSLKTTLTQNLSEAQTKATEAQQHYTTLENTLKNNPAALAAAKAALTTLNTPNPSPIAIQNLAKSYALQAQQADQTAASNQSRITQYNSDYPWLKNWLAAIAGEGVGVENEIINEGGRFSGDVWVYKNGLSTAEQKIKTETATALADTHSSTDLNQVAAQFSALISDITQVSTLKENLSSTGASLTQENAALQKIPSQSEENQLSTLSAAMTHLTTQENQDTVIVEQDSTQESSLNIEKNSLEGQQHTLSGTITSDQSQKAQLKLQMTQASEKLSITNAVIVTQHRKITELTAMLAAAKTTLQQDQNSETLSAEDLQNLQNQITALQTQLTQENATLTSLNQTAQAAAQTVTNLQTQQNTLEQTLQNNVERYTSLADQASTLKEEWIHSKSIKTLEAYDALVEETQRINNVLETLGGTRLPSLMLIQLPKQKHPQPTPPQPTPPQPTPSPLPEPQPVIQEEQDDVPSDEESDNSEVLDAQADDEKVDQQSLDKLAKSQSMASGLIPTPGVLPAGDQVVTGDKT